VPLWFFGSLFTGSYAVTIVLGMLYGVLLAGFVPLSALMPSMVERHDKGAAWQSSTPALAAPRSLGRSSPPCSTRSSATAASSSPTPPSIW